MKPPDDGRPSLRRSLLLWLLAPLLLLVPLAAALIYTLALRPALDGLDRALTDTVVALAQILEVNEGRVTLPLSEQTAHALRADMVDEVFFAVSDERDRLLAGSRALLAQAPSLERDQWAFFEASVDGKPVRVAAHGARCGSRPEQRCAVLVAETLGKRAAAQRVAMLSALLGAAALSLPMAVLAMVAVDRSMRPLQRAAAEVASLTPDHLEPVDADQVPREAAGFVRALNDLLRRLRDAATAQRAFIADAAHQLRTPLAVLRVEAAEALESPHPPELHPLLMRQHAAAERGARLAQQILSLARTETAAMDAQRRMQRLDLARLATEGADRWVAPSLRAGQDLGFDLQPAWVDGDPVLIEELMGNLVHNAIEHAGSGARVTVRTRRLDDGSAELAVEDDGPGIAPEEQDLVWDRFHRGRAAAASGSGLGLAIVRDIARLHRAQAMLGAGAEGRGLRVAVRFLAPAGSGRGQSPM